MHAEKRRGRSRSRILYWFRTPPGVKVGRSALDEDAIRLIEEHNPDVDFDWTRILKGGGEPGEPRKPEPPRREMRQRDVNPHQRRQQVKENSLPTGTVTDAILVPDPVPPDPVPIPDSASEPHTVDEMSASMTEAPVDISQSSAAIPAVQEEPSSPAQARLGAEAVVRLRGRYSEILTRISDRVQDPSRRDELKTEAERLNPDSWVTEAEVQQGLEQYEAVFESLRAVVGRRRRRRRRRESRPDGSIPRVDRAPGPEAETSDNDDSADDGDEPGSGEL